MHEAVTSALAALSAIIVIGFLADYMFKRTGMLDIPFLVILGILLGPVLKVFDLASIASLTPYIAAVSLVIILFDGGLRMSVSQVFYETPRALLLALLGFSFALILVSLLAYYGIGLPPLYSVLLATIYGGGGSSVAVISVVRRLNISDKCEALLSLESIIDDIICVVSSLMMIEAIMSGYIDYILIGREIVGQLFIGAVMGFMFGIVWLSILRKATEKPYAYMLTLATVFLAYAVSEYFGGNGPLSSFVFGLTLGNERSVFKALGGEEGSVVVDGGLEKFEEEVAFFIRSFFFVYLGLIATSVNVNSLFWGGVLSLMLLLLRYFAVKLATKRSPLSGECSVMSLMLTRGLVAAVLATLPMRYGLPYADLYVNTTLVVIILTAVLPTIGMILISRHRKKLNKQNF